MQVDLINVEDPRWASMLGRTTHDIYHLPQYVLLESKGSGSNPVAVYGYDRIGNEFLLPLLIRKLPAGLGLPRSWRDATVPYGYPSPLATSKDCAKVNEFLMHTARLARELSIISMFVRWHPLWQFENRPNISGETTVDHGQTVFVNLLETLEEWRTQTRKETRYNCRRMRGMGFKVVLDNWSLLPAFHEIYTHTMKRVSARENYYYSYDYLVQMIQNLGSHLHLACVISPAGSVAASGLFSECQGIVQYHLSGAAEEFLRYSPTKLMLDEIRCWAKERGNRVLHLGGGVNGAQDSLFAFKAAFSCHRANFQSSRIITDIARYREAVFASQATTEPEGYFPAYRQAG